MTFQKNRPRVAIIGGGPGGLMTAYLLQQRACRSLDVTLFEASSRLGGKILTPRFSQAAARYEAGAAEFYDYSGIDDDPLKDLVEELGLSISPMGGNSVLSGDQFIGNLDDLEWTLGRQARQAVEKFHLAARDSISPAEFCTYAGSESPATLEFLPGSTSSLGTSCASVRFDQVLNSIQPATASKYIERMIHSDLATEPPKTSLAYGLQNYLMNDPAYMVLYGIDGGNEQLPQRLAERITAQVRINHRIDEIESGPNQKYALRWTSDAGQGQDEFDYVVVALPHDALRHLRFRGQRLQAALARHWSYYHYPADYLRVTLLFRDAFWRATMIDSYTMLDTLEGCCLYDESSRVPDSDYGILGWLLAGQAAANHAGLSNQELVQLALASLPEKLSMAADYLIEGRVHRWLGAVNAIPGGLVPLPLDLRHQPEPTESPHFFVVGDYLFDSTLNGVLDSADYVSQWVANLTLE